MANAPTVLDTFLAAEQTIASETSLDRQTRAAVHLTVAAANQCDDTWQRDIAAGWSEQELLEAFADTIRTNSAFKSGDHSGFRRQVQRISATPRPQ